MSCTIYTENLSKTYRGIEALARLNLEIPENAIYGLIGPNGAGKSTTLKILMNIIQATSGRSEVMGVDSAHLSHHDLTRIGYLSEDQAAPVWMTVDGLLSYLQPFYPSWDMGLAQELMHGFNLPPSSKISELSRGMRMKAALASVLAYRPKLLILDEPFAGLDPLVRDELIDGVLAVAEGTTMLIASHDMAEIERFVSHVGFIDKGRLHVSEEMETLAGRFREIEIVSDGEPPVQLPKEWLNVERLDRRFRWVDAQFEHTHTIATIRRVFGDVQQFEARPMALRSIFVTLAKVSRSAEG